MALALLGGLLVEYFGFWCADYLATGIMIGFFAKEAIESRRELRDETSNMVGNKN